MALPNVDLDLFINAMSKAHSDAAKSPSILGAAMGGFMKGIDDQQKWESEQQRQVLRANQIQQIPVANRIQEGQAASLEAQTAAYRANPQKFTDVQLANQDALIAEQKRQALLETQKTKLLSIIKDSDEKTKADAIYDPQFTEVFAANPKLKDEILSQAGYWTDTAQAQRVFDAKYADLRAKHRAEKLDLAKQSFATTFPEFERSGNINKLTENVAAVFKDMPIANIDLVLHGEIRTERVPGSGSPVPVYEADGVTPVFEADGKTVKLQPPPGKYVDNFYFGKGANKKKIGEMDPNTLKEWTKFKSDFYALNDLDSHSGGLKDIELRSRLNAERREKERAQAQAQADADNKEKQSYADRFNSSARVAPDLIAKTPLLRKALEKTQDQIAANRQEEAAARRLPDSRISEIQEAVITTPRGRGELEPGAIASPEMAQRFNNPETRVAPNRAPVFKTEELKARAASRVGDAMQRRGLDVPAPSAAQQESGVTPARPERITNKLGNFTPSDEVVNKVNSYPEMEGAPAIVKAIIAQESRGKANAKSETNVFGLGQITGPTARGMFGNFDRNNPEHQIVGSGVRLALAMSHPVLKENPLLSIAAMNGGEFTIASAVEKAGTTDWNVVKNYVLDGVKANKKLLEEIAPFNVTPERKAAEIIKHVERVVSYFPKFARTADDYAMAQRLKDLGAIDFEDIRQGRVPGAMI